MGEPALGFRVLGLHDLSHAITHAAHAFKHNLHDALHKASLEVAGRAKFYIRGKRRTNPPELLGVVTGRLRQSITGRVEQRGPYTVGVVGPQRVTYAAIHEFGGSSTFHGRAVYIPPRPYLAPALRDMEPRINSLLDGAVAQIVTDIVED